MISPQKRLLLVKCPQAFFEIPSEVEISSLLIQELDFWVTLICLLRPLQLLSQLIWEISQIDYYRYWIGDFERGQNNFGG